MLEECPARESQAEDASRGRVILCAVLRSTCVSSSNLWSVMSGCHATQSQSDRKGKARLHVTVSGMDALRQQ
jgi:hypothetical protein